MARQIQVFIPLDNNRLPLIRHYLKSEHDVHGLTHFKGTENDLFLFKCREKDTGPILEALSHLGAGTKFGSVDIIPIHSTKPRLGPRPNKEKYRVIDRMSTEEIFELVDSMRPLTFNFLSLVIIASIIAGIGLLTDSAVSVVASMVVSPLMGPIVAMTFGTAVRDKTMVLKGLRNEMIGMSLSLIVGLTIGTFMGFVLPTQKWGGYEMESRGTMNSFWAGLAVAIPSGAGVAFSVISSSSSLIMVGLAIAAALLPPLVNSGLNISYGLVLYSDVMHYNRVEEGEKLLVVAMWSILIFLVNMLFIYLTALFVFWIKKIRPVVKKYHKDDSLNLNSSHSRFEFDPLLTLARVKDADFNDDDFITSSTKFEDDSLLA